MSSRAPHSLAKTSVQRIAAQLRPLVMLPRSVSTEIACTAEVRATLHRERLHRFILNAGIGMVNGEIGIVNT